MKSINKFKLPLVIGFLLTALFIGRAFSQTAGNSLPVPTISFTYNAGEVGGAPEEGTTNATITVEIPEAQKCECGIRLEGKLAEESQWTALALYSPQETGDDYQQTSWTYTGNYFLPDKVYDFRALVYDRVGEQSTYGTSRLTMTPYREAPCSDGTFANVKKETIGEGEEALIQLFWDKVCSQTKEANKYNVYKNGQLLAETDSGATNFVYPGAPVGATWKIEAFGDEPPSNDPSVISACDQVKSKMNAKGANVAEVEHCQVRNNNWLGVMVKFSPVPVGGPYPSNWLVNSRINIPPYFNYPPGHIFTPPPIEMLIFNANDICADHSNNNGHYFPSTDSWGQFDWICPQPEYQGQGYGTLTTWRAWVNFDLGVTGGGGEPIWPITTEFVY